MAFSLALTVGFAFPFRANASLGEKSGVNGEAVKLGIGQQHLLGRPDSSAVIVADRLN